jgi:hypothetical protein
LPEEAYAITTKTRGRKPAKTKRSDEDVEDDLASLVARAAKGIQTVADATDEESIVVDSWMFHGKEYYKDGGDKVYSTEMPYDQIGQFVPESGKIAYLAPTTTN